jgi:hypothetical protein
MSIHFSRTRNVLYYFVPVSILIVYLTFVGNVLLHVTYNVLGMCTLQDYICTRFRLPSPNGSYEEVLISP